MPLILLAASGLIIYSFDRIVGDLLSVSILNRHVALRVSNVVDRVACIYTCLLKSLASSGWKYLSVNMTAMK